MKIIGLLLWLLSVVGAGAQTNQSWTVCRHPIRVFASHEAVDLTPLFQWWQQRVTTGKMATNAETNPDALRPLSSWHRLFGLKVSDVENSWLVDAVIYTSPNSHTSARIVLNHPPAAEERTFNALKNQLTEAALQITNLQRAYKADLREAQKAERLAADYRRSGTKHATESSNNYIHYATQKREAATAALSQQKQLENALLELRKQLKAIPSKNGKYLVDWFALEAGRGNQDMPIYDLGVVPPNAP